MFFPIKKIFPAEFHGSDENFQAWMYYIQTKIF